MKASTLQRSLRRRPISLFEPAPQGSSRDIVRERVAHFARAVAARHLSERGRGSECRNRNNMLVALRGYYLAWSLCAPFRLPALDEDLLAAADAAYRQACGVRKQPAAA